MMGSEQDLVRRQHEEEAALRTRNQEKVLKIITDLAVDNGWSDEDRDEILGSLGLLPPQG